MLIYEQVEEFTNLCFYNIMNYIRMTAMKAAKNYVSNHATLNSNIHLQDSRQDQVKKDKNIFTNHKVEFQNSNIVGFEKPRNTLKHKQSLPCFEGTLSTTPVSAHSHSLFHIDNQQILHTSSVALGQCQNSKNYLNTCSNQEQMDFFHSNSCQHFNNTENRYKIKQQGNKIIISPINNHTLYSQSSRNSIRNQQSSLQDSRQSVEQKHTFSQASTQHTRKQEMKNKSSTNDLEFQNNIRMKKTVFQAPAFLKNKKNHQQAQKQKVDQQRLNCSIPKDFKTYQPICHFRDAAILHYIDQKSQRKVNKNRNGRINCTSAQKKFRPTSQYKRYYNNKFDDTSHGKMQQNIGLLPIRKQVNLRILSQSKLSNAHLKVLKLLAQHQATSVYLVVEKYTGFLYCLKKTEISYSDLLNQKRKRQQVEDYLIRESKIGMFLDHPLLIKNYCTLLDNRNIYQLMEFMEGSTLQSQSFELKKKSVKKETPVHSLSEIRNILSQLLEAINHMHSKNIAHRDLKPANIFVSNNHAFKIGDFGCSVYDQPNDFVGTLDYVAPEIMLHQNHGVSVDLWALGCIAFQLYVGYPPFYHPKSKQTIKRIIQCKFDAFLIRDGKLRDFIQKLLQKEGDRRMTASQAQHHEFLRQIRQIRQNTEKRNL